MVKGEPMNIYFEGSSADRSAREGLRRLIEKLQLPKMPTIVNCGGRPKTFSDFKKSGAGKHLLLIDSEGHVSEDWRGGEHTHWTPWDFLMQVKAHDHGIYRPEWASHNQCHLMVQKMEYWFVADSDALERFYGKGFEREKLPKWSGMVDNIQSDKLMSGLIAATRNTAKGPYGKGNISFRILGELNPETVERHSPWAKRFFDHLRQHCQ